MPYTPTDWVDGVTPVDAAHMDKIEAGILASEEAARKNQPNGYAPLDVGARVPNLNLPMRLQEVPLSSANLDTDADLSGWYYYHPTTVGRPVDGYGYVQSYGFVGALTTTQIAYAHGSLEMWIRSKSGGLGAAWVKLYDATGGYVGPLPSRLGPSSHQLANANLATVTGFYNVFADPGANTPDTGMHWFLYVNTVGPDYCHQFATALYDNRVYTRRGGQGGWGGWSKVYPVDNAGLPGRLQSLSNGVSTAADINLLVESGWSYVSNTAANVPVATDLMVETIGFAAGFCVQLAYDFYSPAVWKRRQQGVGNWTAWVQMMDTSGQVGNLPPRLGEIPPIVTDLNPIMTTGWCLAQQGVTANTPYGASGASGQWGTVRTEMLNVGGNSFQTYIEFLSNRTWERRAISGVWEPWRQIYPTPYATTLPASPVDGQEAILVGSLTNSPYYWRFRYNASSTAAGGKKWEFIGGTDYVAFPGDIARGPGTGFESGTSEGWLTVPRTGDYVVAVGARMSNPSGGNASLYIAPCINSIGAVIAQCIAGGGNMIGSADLGTEKRQLFAFTAGDVIKYCTYSSIPSVGNFSGAQISIIPQRVS